MMCLTQKQQDLFAWLRQIAKGNISDQILSTDDAKELIHLLEKGHVVLHEDNPNFRHYYPQFFE